MLLSPCPSSLYALSCSGADIAGCPSLSTEPVRPSDWSPERNGLTPLQFCSRANLYQTRRLKSVWRNHRTLKCWGYPSRSRRLPLGVLCRFFVDFLLSLPLGSTRCYSLVRGAYELLTTPNNEYVHVATDVCDCECNSRNHGEPSVGFDIISDASELTSKFWPTRRVVPNLLYTLTRHVQVRKSRTLYLTPTTSPPSLWPLAMPL